MLDLGDAPGGVEQFVALGDAVMRRTVTVRASFGHLMQDTVTSEPQRLNQALFIGLPRKQLLRGKHLPVAPFEE